MGYQIPIDLLNKTGGGPDTFEQISDWHIKLLQQHIGLKPDMDVVEIGCGIGRDAIPFTQILDQKGSYLGTDVIRPSIEWCTENISRKHSNFEFVWHDIYDDLHNPDGAYTAQDIVLPREDKSVDLIVLQSVFTHMFDEEIKHYLEEFERVLRPGGVVWASVFIVDEAIRKHISELAPTQYALSFRHPLGNGCYINNTDSKRGAVAFTRDRLDELVEGSGLVHARDPLRGGWSEYYDQPEFGQDCLILKNVN